jgi:AcrR family transcriptional regulator
MTSEEVTSGVQATAPRRRRLSPETRRESLLAAARDEFADTPYDEASVGAIAARAGASEALVYRYFQSKAALYARVVEDAIESLSQRQAAALALLPAGSHGNARLAATVSAYLDHIATHPVGWSAPQRLSGSEPAEALAVREQARARYVAALTAEVGEPHSAVTRFAVAGYFGFLEAACLNWVDAGCRDHEREVLVASAAGALAGALRR